MRNPWLPATHMALNSLSTNASLEPSLEKEGNTPDTLKSPTSECGEWSLWKFLWISSPCCPNNNLKLNLYC